MNNFLKFNNKLEEFYNIDYNFHIFSFLFLPFQQLAYLQIPTFLLSSPSIGQNIRLNADNFTVPAFNDSPAASQSVNRNTENISQ